MRVEIWTRPAEVCAKLLAMLTGRESWVLDELATAGRENLDAVHVARYDDKENGDAGDEVSMLLAVGLGNRPTVIDLGAGTGQFTLAAAESARRVIAVDVSPVMLEHLRAKVEWSHLANVECVQAGFLTYEHTGDLADLVYSRYALQVTSTGVVCGVVVWGAVGPSDATATASTS